MAVNSSSNDTVYSTRDSSFTSTTFALIQYIFYVTIFIIGVIGNILVCLVICRKRRMRTVTNYFIVNLSAADLLVLCVCIPFDFGEKIAESWPYGGFLCRVIYPLQTLMTNASVATLVAISLIRFHAVVYPLRPQMSTIHAKLVIILIWLWSLALVAPYIVALRTTDGACDEFWGAMNPKVYTICIFLAQYLLPLTIIGLAYTRIGQDLYRHKCHDNNSMIREQDHEARRVVKMMLIVVIVFAVLMFPNHTLFIWKDFGSGGDYIHFWDIVAFCQILIYANSATNPIIYSACNENFREGFQAYFKSFITCINIRKLSTTVRQRKKTILRDNMSKEPLKTCTARCTTGFEESVEIQL